jgi:hypothetical protein
MKRESALPAMGAIHDAGHREENRAVAIRVAEGETLYLAIP